MTETRGAVMAWMVVDEDRGVLRTAPTRKQLVDWACGLYDGRVISRQSWSRAFYEYSIGSDEEASEQVWIARKDVVAHHGFDPGQEPWYPTSDPYAEGARALAAEG